MLRAADRSVANRVLDDDTWQALKANLDGPELEFVLLVGHYDMLATFLLTLRVTPDRSR